MPPLNAGAGQAPGHGRGAPTATALAGLARHKMALHLPADATFRHALENKLHLQPFRGIVTGVDRGSDGRNSVHIQRTGQLHADPSLYPVFASKLIPIVGDEVLLEYVAGSPTAMVTQARKGGRPDELDIPYAGGSRRIYDANRGLVQLHGDDHHQRNYRSDGVTIAQFLAESGTIQAINDIIHSAQALGGSGGVTGPAVRHTRNASVNQRYEMYVTAGGAEHLTTHHDKSGDHGYYVNGVLQVNHISSGTGAKTRLKQHNASSFHEYGDDGGGKVRAVHGSGTGQWIMDGQGHFINAVTGGYGDVQAFQLVGALIAGQPGGVMQYRQSTSAAYHLTGDVGDGNMTSRSQSGAHKTQVANGTYTHTKTQNGYIYPSGAYLNAPTADTTRIDVLRPTNAGALKQASHSYTITTQGSGTTVPVTSPQPAYHSGATGGGNIVNFTGDGGYSVPHFRITDVILWTGSNDGTYAHGDHAMSRHFGWGHGTKNGTSESNTAAWTIVATFGDNGLWIYGGTYSGSAFSGTATMRTMEVDV